MAGRGASLGFSSRRLRDHHGREAMTAEHLVAGAGSSEGQIYIFNHMMHGGGWDREKEVEREREGERERGREKERERARGGVRDRKREGVERNRRKERGRQRGER